MNTKDRILDAAERLFARDGFEATSLRAITTEAQVNLAAVNYHFQTKDALVEAVVGRRIRPVNEQRIGLLDAYQAQSAGAPLPLERVLDAFLRPIVEMVSGHAREFVPLIGRLYTEPGDFAEKLYKQQFEHLRFFPVLSRILPDLPADELAWRLHFAIGALAHTMAASKMLELMSGGRCHIADPERTLARLKSFIAAGLTAPVSIEAQHAYPHHAAH